MPEPPGVSREQGGAQLQEGALPGATEPGLPPHLPPEIRAAPKTGWALHTSKGLQLDSIKGDLGDSPRAGGEADRRGPSPGVGCPPATSASQVCLSPSPKPPPSPRPHLHSPGEGAKAAGPPPPLQALQPGVFLKAASHPIWLAYLVEGLSLGQGGAHCVPGWTPVLSRSLSLNHTQLFEVDTHDPNPGVEKTRAQRG